MSRPMIGVVPLYDEEKRSYWMLPGYFQGIEQAGGLPVMLPLTAEPELLRQVADTMDGFLFTGGQDVAPSVYGAAPTPQCGAPCLERDAMEKELLRLALERDKPLFGICRGIQFLNAALGGTLYQDLPTEHPSAAEHHQTPPYDRPVHQVSIVPGSALEALLGCQTLAVNSYHHQAVKDLAPGLEAMAESEDGLIEAVRLPSARFAWAVQWHPEFSYRTEASSRKLLAAFVAACKM